MVYYAARELCDQYTLSVKGEKRYADVPIIHVLAIACYEPKGFESRKTHSYIERWEILNSETKEIASDVFDWTYIYLPAFDKQVVKKDGAAKFTPKELLDGWLFFLSGQTPREADRIKLRPELVCGDPALESAFDRMVNLTKDERLKMRKETKRRADDQAAKIAELEDAKEKGRAEGEIIGELKFAIKRFMKGKEISEDLDEFSSIGLETLTKSWPSGVTQEQQLAFISELKKKNLLKAEVEEEKED
ncbi:hypothetical protein ADUPG1_007345 [Aduncisulcus paluster]|uniref:PD-(D/E)XK nuclease family transposase n=1 Tax=Aduncisulcus paluster TaxID=2918883 RepID=A0ABQ5KLR1_9EUKA|nr:hypothetical protein ADUPG1_007345 [Aduncisulcus paluster]